MMWLRAFQRDAVLDPRTRWSCEYLALLDYLDRRDELDGRFEAFAEPSSGPGGRPPVLPQGDLPGWRGAGDGDRLPALRASGQADGLCRWCRARMEWGHEAAGSVTAQQPGPARPCSGWFYRFPPRRGAVLKRRRRVSRRRPSRTAGRLAPHKVQPWRSGRTAGSRRWRGTGAGPVPLGPDAGSSGRHEPGRAPPQHHGRGIAGCRRGGRSRLPRRTLELIVARTATDPRPHRDLQSSQLPDPNSCRSGSRPPSISRNRRAEPAAFSLSS